MMDTSPTTYRQRDAVNGTVLASGELVLLDLRTQRYYTLNATGGTVWERLDDWQALDDLARAVTRAYAVDEETARDSVERLLDELLREGLVVTAQSP